ncbi:MAG: hypothetical protein IKP06_05155 [Elusimicrobiaceae bacterium]|nr:hypothetical protein [Elusimicrobiaceae bacterium]
MFTRNALTMFALSVMFIFSTAVISFYSAHEVLIRALSLILLAMNVLLFIVNYREIQKHKILFLLMLVACFFPFATVAAGFYESQRFIDNMASAIHMYNVILFIGISPAIYLSDRQIKFLLLIPVIGLIWLVAYYHTFEFAFLPFFWPPNDLAKAYFYMFMCLILWHYLRGSNRGWMFLWFTVSFILSYKIECRSTLMAGIFFALLCCCDRWFKRPLLYKSLMNGLLVGGIVFAAMYVYLYLSFFRMDLSWAFHQAGKGVFSGRETIWLELFRGLQQHPFLGLGREALAWSVTWNTGDTHNSSMYVLCLFGIPVFVICLFLFNKAFSCFQEVIEKDIVSRRAFDAFLSMLLLGFFESNVVTTPFMVFTFFMFFIINSRYKSRSKV